MNKQSAFLFLPLFFVFNALGFQNHHTSDYSSFWNQPRAQLVDRGEARFVRNDDVATNNQDTGTTGTNTPDSTFESSTTESAQPPIGSNTPSMPGLPNTGDIPPEVDASNTPFISVPSIPFVPLIGSPDEGTSTPAPSESSSTPTDTAPQTPPVSAPSTSSSGDVFSTGAVTFRFDDGWSSQLAALAVLNDAGIKGSFYIVTRQLSDDGFTGFMSTNDVQALASSGQDIGAHTQTHPHLPTMSASAQQSEIAGSRADLIAMGITPSTFSYPFGEYTQTTLQIVKDSGFAGAVTTEETPVSQSSDPYQIQSPSLQLSDTPEKIASMIDSAVTNHQWLIITFHRIDNSGDQYSISPENFQQVVDYVKSHNIRTVTVSEGLQSLTR